MLGNLTPAKDDLVILGRGLIKLKKKIVQRIGEVASFFFFIFYFF